MWERRAFQSVASRDGDVAILMKPNAQAFLMYFVGGCSGCRHIVGPLIFTWFVSIYFVVPIAACLLETCIRSVFADPTIHIFPPAHTLG